MIKGMLAAGARLFTVQGSWNYERMIAVGLADATIPLLRDLPGGLDGERGRAAVARAAGYFNAHPYLAGIAAGALARAEHDGAPPAQIERLRLALIGPLGSVGDRLVWAGALPAAIGIGLALAATAPVGVGAVVFLVVYNAIHFTLRWWGLAAGWRYGMSVARALSGGVLVFALRLATPLAGLAVGVALPLVAAWLLKGIALRLIVGAFVLGAVATLVLARLAPALGVLRLGLLAAAAAIAGVWLWP